MIVFLGFSQEKIFKQISRVCHNTFKILRVMLGSCLLRKNTQTRETISAKNKLVMLLHEFGFRNTLCTIGKVYGVVENRIKKIMMNLCTLVSIHLQGTFGRFPSPNRYWVLA